MPAKQTPHHHQIEIEGKAIDIALSERANQALTRRSHPLRVEMELYFSCLIRKKLRFHEDSSATTQGMLVNDHLQVAFRPVMTAACGKDYEGSEPPLTDFPIANSRPYIPHWLYLDYSNGQWTGEFGYTQK